jgi:prolyl 4-hydroxylase
MLDTIYRRTADLVNISESLLQPGSAGNIVEELQVVHYENGQEYTAHHDFGDSGRANQRYLTLLFYLNEQLHDKAGGETNFPKGDNGRGLKVHPGKGNAILFYSMLPDGNADDKSLHATLPVHEGIKWLANFWIWDPRR